MTADARHLKRMCSEFSDVAERLYPKATVCPDDLKKIYLAARREPEDADAHLWDMRKEFPCSQDTTFIMNPLDHQSYYRHKRMNEPKHAWYAYDKNNYFDSRWRRDMNKYRTWGTYNYNLKKGKFQGEIVFKPLNKRLHWSARELLKKHWMKNDPVCSWYDFDKDEEAYKELMRVFKTWLESGISACAWHADKRKVVGVALGQSNTGLYPEKKRIEYDTFSGITKRMLSSRNYIIKRVTNLWDLMDFSYYVVFITVVTPHLKKRSPVMRMLTRASLSAGREMQVHYMLAITSAKEQEQGYELCGMRKIMELPLRYWTDHEEHYYYNENEEHYNARLRAYQVWFPKWPEYQSNQFHYEKKPLPFTPRPTDPPEIGEETMFKGVWERHTSIHRRWWDFSPYNHYSKPIGLYPYALYRKRGGYYDNLRESVYRTRVRFTRGESGRFHDKGVLAWWDYYPEWYGRYLNTVSYDRGCISAYPKHLFYVWPSFYRKSIADIRVKNKKYSIRLPEYD